MPRGLQEISDTLATRIKKGTFLVHDGWTSTDSAIERLGYSHAPPVVHEKEYRDTSTGYHTNDAESENSRFRAFGWRRYGRLQLNKDELDEYIFYVNVGQDVKSVLEGLAVANGGLLQNPEPVP